MSEIQKIEMMDYSLAENFLICKTISLSNLRNLREWHFLFVQIGPAMENWAKKLFVDGDAALSYLIDTVASITVDQATDVLHDYIEKRMKMYGLKITNRFSPGYCDWSVSEQHLLFSFLPANFCGITLTESSLMVPIKSVSGIIGIGKTVKRVDYSCDICGMKDCRYRVIRFAKAERT